MTIQRIWAGFVLSVVSLFATCFASAQLSTQVEKLEGYKAVVAGERAIVRCGPGAAYYPVSSELKQGIILTVDGQTSSGWLRVSYPESATALVRADHVEVQTDTQTAVLNRESALAAFNASTGARGSWSKLLAEPLPAGTRLQIVAEAENELTGELAGYQVEPPASARGYIRSDALRRATSADLEAAGAAVADSEPAGVETSSDVAQESGSDLAVVPTSDVEGDTPSAPDANADFVPAGSESEGDVRQASETVESSPVDDEAEAAEVVAEVSNDEPAEEAPAPRVIQSLADLNTAFDEVQAQPMNEAEFDQLLSEVDRMLAATPDTPANQGLIEALESRQTVLRLRQRIQQVYRDNQAAANAASEAAQETERAVAKIKRDLGFTAVGRLLPSAVYDGERLPRMFRIQALDTTEAPRTLGYLRPDPAFGYESKLNQTVGVVGAVRNDARLNLQVIEPIRVELVEVDGGSR